MATKQAAVAFRIDWQQRISAERWSSEMESRGEWERGQAAARKQCARELAALNALPADATDPQIRAALCAVGCCMCQYADAPIVCARQKAVA